MQYGDLSAVYMLIRAAFSQDVAPGYSQQGVQNFLAYVSQEQLVRRLEQGHLTWVAHESATIVGVLQIRLPLHLCMLFVSPDTRRVGVARRLWDHAVHTLRAQHPEGVVTVNSSPYAVQAYEHLGFVRTGAVTDVGGIISQPMERHLGQSSEHLH